jgi:hypothetical protein
MRRDRTRLPFSSSSLPETTCISELFLECFRSEETGSCATRETWRQSDIDSEREGMSITWNIRQWTGLGHEQSTRVETKTSTDIEHWRTLFASLNWEWLWYFSLTETSRRQHLWSHLMYIYIICMIGLVRILEMRKKTWCFPWRSHEQMRWLLLQENETCQEGKHYTHERHARETLILQRNNHFLHACKMQDLVAQQHQQQRQDTSKATTLRTRMTGLTLTTGHWMDKKQQRILQQQDETLTLTHTTILNTGVTHTRTIRLLNCKILMYSTLEE